MGKMTRTTERYKNQAIIAVNYGDPTTYYSVTARSKKHANRLAEILDWYSYSSGLRYARLWYNSRAKRLEYVQGLDV